MIPAAIVACANLAVPAPVMHHVAMVESGGNPYAIGVVGGRLLRQPDNLIEAVATAEALAAQGYNFSVGVAQVNRVNFAAYGLDSYQKAFSTCDNLVAGSRILADCHARMHGAWDRALSCYYSGDPETGLREGYVQRVLAAMDTASRAEMAAAHPLSASIPVTPVPSRSESGAPPDGTVAGRVDARLRMASRALPMRGSPAELTEGFDDGGSESSGRRPDADLEQRSGLSTLRPANVNVVAADSPTAASATVEPAIGPSGSASALEPPVARSRAAASAAGSPGAAKPAVATVTTSGGARPPSVFIPRVSGAATGAGDNSTGPLRDAAESHTSPASQPPELDRAFVF